MTTRQPRTRPRPRRQTVRVPVISSLDSVDFNAVRRGRHRYVVDNNNNLIVTRACLLNMKLAKPLSALNSTPTELVPCYSAVKLNSVTLWVKPIPAEHSSGATPDTEPPAFIWMSENSNGKSSKVQRGTTQLVSRTFKPHDRCAMWSNHTSTPLTQGETLFELRNADNCILDVDFSYVESCGSEAVVTVTSTGFTNSAGLVYAPLDNMAPGLLTIGGWHLEPKIDRTRCTVTTGTKPSVFTRS